MDDRVLAGHPDDVLPNLLPHPRSTLPLGLVGPLGSDESLVPGEDGVRRDNRGHTGKDSTSKHLALRCKPTALRVSESKPLALELFPEDTILLDQIINDLTLLTIDPTRKHAEEELQRREMG